MIPIDPNKLSNTRLVKKPKIVKLPAIKTKDWNKIASHFEKQKYSFAVRQSKFLHPWSVLSAWLPVNTKVQDDLSLASLEPAEESKKEPPHAWHLQIMPGFVNGTPVRLSVKAKNASMHSRLRIQKERVAAGKTKGTFPEDEEMIDVPLTELPYYELSSDGCRPVGFGALPTVAANEDMKGASFQDEKFPEVFKAMGVKGADIQIDLSAAGVKITEGEQVDPATVRLLKAIDVVLKVERASLKFDSTFGNPAIDGYSELITPRYARNAPLRRYAEIIFDSGPFKPPPEFTMEEILGNSDPADPEYDYRKLATVYFISPFAPESDVINGQWQVEVKYEQFWNLCYMPAEIPPMIPPEPIRILTFIGGGIASSIFNMLLAPVNDGFARLFAQLRAKRLYGKFWST
jgi:hypothetical protein